MGEKNKEIDYSNLKEKKKDAIIVASIGMHKVFMDYVNPNSNNYIDFSINNDSAEELLTTESYKITKIPVKDIKPGQYVLSLNESSGKLEPAKVKELLDMGEKPIYELCNESGRCINTTSEHPYLVKSFKGGDVLNAKEEIINNLPLNSEGLTFSNNFDNSENVVSIKGGVVFNTTIPKCSLGGNNLLLRKCLSNVNITLDSDLASLDNCLSEIPKGDFLISYPCFFNNSSISFGRFSSERSLRLFLEENMFLFSDEFRGIFHNRQDGRFCEQWKIILKNLINTNSCSEQFQNLPDHDSCSFESGGSAADFSISDNIFINFNSHQADNNAEYLSFSEWLKVKELGEGMEIAVPNEDVNAKNQISLSKNILSNSSVVNTGTNDCSLRCGSLDQMAELVDNASARKSTSSKSEIVMDDFPRKLSYSDSLKNLIEPSISVCFISNSCSESPDFSKHSFLCLLSSDLMNSGARNSALIDANKYVEIDLGFIIENKELVSNTNLILVFYEYSFLFSGDIFFNKFSLISGEISLSNCLNLPFFALLPKSTDHLINSCSSLECSLFNNCSACFLRSANIVLISSDQFTQENSAISAFNSSSTANVIDAIYISPLAFNSSNFLSSLILSDIALRATAATFTSGNSFLNSANNSSGTDTVTLGILDNSVIYFNTSKDVQVFKTFDDWVKELKEGMEIAVSGDYLSNLGYARNLELDNTNNLPLNSEGSTDLNSLLSEYCSESINGGFISKNITPNESFGGNLFLFKKSLSRVNITLCSDLALSSIFGSLDLNLTRTISNPLLNKNSIKPTGIFSSAINETSSCDLLSIFNSFRSQYETCKDSFSSELGIVFFENFSNCNSSTKKSYDVSDKYSGIFKCQAPTTDFSVSDNMFINFNSHKADNNAEYLSFSEWLKVSELKEEGYSYLILIPGWDSNAFKTYSSISFDPEKVNPTTSLVSVLQIVTPAAPNPSLSTPNLTVITKLMNNDSYSDYLKLLEIKDD